MSCAGSCQQGRRPCDCKPVLRVIARSGLDFEPVEPEEKHWTVEDTEWIERFVTRLIVLFCAVAVLGVLAGLATQTYFN